MKTKPIALTLVGAVSACALIAACSPKKVDQAPAASNISADAAQPQAGKPAADMQKVLDKLASLGGKPIETLSHTDARMQPTPADAVKGVMKDQGMSTDPDPAVTTKDITYPAGAGTQKARIYMPAGAKGPLPVVLYIHGGGWVIADIDTYDASPRAIAKGRTPSSSRWNTAMRRRPSSPPRRTTPTPPTSGCWPTPRSGAATRRRSRCWARAPAATWPSPSAMNARDNHLQAPAAVVAVYPVADSNMATASK